MLETLPSIPLFMDLEPAQTDLLKSLFEPYFAQADTVIFKQGEPANFLYILIKGTVAIHYKPYDGSSIILTRLRDGDVFGWSAVVGSGNYTSSILSETVIESVRIKGNNLQSLIHRQPETGKILVDRLANIVSSRWKNAHDQAKSILNSDPSDK